MRLSSRLAIIVLTCLLIHIGAAEERAAPDAVDLDTPLAMDSLISQIASKRVVFAGEIHTRYDHHLNQLEIIRRLHQTGKNLAIGVEYFPQSSQPQIDDYIAGRTTEDQFLRAVDYYRTWGYDYRLYAPIFRFAREQKIPVRALNVPESLPAAVAQSGFADLSKEQRASLPAGVEPNDIPPADPGYRARLRAAFQQHGSAKPGDFDHFVDAQLVWDESMAANAAAYLTAHPESRMVILAGSGHIAFGSGIPSRLERRTHVTYAIVLSSGEEIEPKIADYILLSSRQDLPPAGTLGASLKDEHRECRIQAVLPGGAAEKAGIKRGDILADLDGHSITSISDVRLALWDKKPGDRVRVRVHRKHRFGSGSDHDFDVALGGGGRP